MCQASQMGWHATNRRRSPPWATAKVIGLDIAKNTFVAVSLNSHGTLADEKSGLSRAAIATFTELKAQLDDKDVRIAVYDARRTQAAKEDPHAADMMEVPGVCKIIATAVLAAAYDPCHFSNGRDFSANLGLVPRECSSSGKQRLFGITKRGDTYLCTLLIHGARSAGEKPDKMLRWAVKLSERSGVKVAAVAVALANKMARVLWTILAHGHVYVQVWSKSMTKPAGSHA